MKQSDPLEFVAPGSLAPPGPVGRLLRLGLGVLCLFGLWNLAVHLDAIIAMPFTAIVHSDFAFLSMMCLGIFNYVVNIGFSKSWGRRPMLVSIAGFVILGSLALLIDGELNSPILGVPLFAWLAYFYSHLGISFVLACVLATPGCEMRALPELFGLITGRPAAEHNCPASFITRIDEWEHRRVAA
jgi:hypothetical protein